MTSRTKLLLGLSLAFLVGGIVGAAAGFYTASTSADPSPSTAPMEAGDTGFGKAIGRH
jgi:hypothetical protein